MVTQTSSKPIGLGMTTPTPDAYLLATDDPENENKKQSFIEHISVAPMGSKVPMYLEVQWVDSLGNPSKTGSISGTIETVIEFEGEAPIVVFSTGERVSLETFHS
jgi:hypothetical protein